MGLLEDGLSHIGQIFLLALAGIAAALALDYLSGWISRSGSFSPYLVRGIDVLAYGIFVLDGIMILGASGIAVVNLFKSVRKGGQ